MGYKEYKTCKLDHHGGERYPHLVREGSKPDYLNELTKAFAEHK